MLQRMNLQIALVVLGIMLAATAQAGAISGTFDMSGIVTVTSTSMTWQTDAPGNAPNFFTLTNGAGSFTLADGQNGIANLNIAAEPVGSTFPPIQFITFDVGPALPALDINFIWPGFGGTAACSAPPAVGQTCTPPNPGGSPFTFTNNPPPATPQSSAQWDFSGITSDGLSSWNAIFTAQFNKPFQTVLAAFGPGGSGSVTNTYSATVTVSLIPEPGTIALFAGGLALVAIGRRKHFRA